MASIIRWKIMVWFILVVSPERANHANRWKHLIIEQINQLKLGNFDADLIESAVNNLIVGRVREQENASQMAFILHDRFVVGAELAGLPVQYSRNA